MDRVTFGGDGQLAVTQVADYPLAEGHGTPEGRCHPTAGRHQDTGLLTGVEKRRGAIGLDDSALAQEGDGAPFPLGDDG